MFKKPSKTNLLRLNQSGLAHLLYPILGLVVVAVIAGAGFYVYQQNTSGAGCQLNQFSQNNKCVPKPPPKPKNPHTANCPSNKVKYGVPKGKTATELARKNVFGSHHPNASTTEVNFMGKNVHVNKKIEYCLRAVEWDLVHKYKTKYQLNHIFGISRVDDDNPRHYFHAYGGAVDINPPSNPFYRDCKNRCPHDMPDSWVKAFRAHGFFWGGHYKDSKDYMHFEWHGEK